MIEFEAVFRARHHDRRGARALSVSALKSTEHGLAQTDRRLRAGFERQHRVRPVWRRYGIDFPAFRHLRRCADRGEAAPLVARVARDARRHCLGPFDRNTVDAAISVAHNPVFQPANDAIEGRLDAGQLPSHDAVGCACGAVAFRIGDGAAQHQRLVPRRKRAVVLRVQRLLLALGDGGRSGKEQRCGCECGADHGAHPIPPMTKGKRAKGKGRKRSRPDPLPVSLRNAAYASSNSSSDCTGPES